MFNYDKLHIEFMQYLAENFDMSMGECALHAEQLVSKVEEQIEEELSNNEE